MRKFWLGFGGVQIIQKEDGGRQQAATFEAASGNIIFEPVYRYKTTDIDFKIKNKFLGYRVVIELNNLVNSWSGEDIPYRSLIKMLNQQNKQQRTDRYRWSVVPKYSSDSGAINYTFADMILDDNINIRDAERFKCFQEFNTLTFVTRKLTREIPNIFDEEIYSPTPIYDITKAVDSAGWGTPAVRSWLIEPSAPELEEPGEPL